MSPPRRASRIDPMVAPRATNLSPTYSGGAWTFRWRKLQKLKTISRDPVSLEMPVGRDKATCATRPPGFENAFSQGGESDPAAIRHRLRAEHTLEECRLLERNAHGFGLFAIGGPPQAEPGPSRARAE